MSRFTLTPIQMREGVWHGILKGNGPEQPQVGVSLLNEALPDVALTVGDDANEWILTVPVPAHAIADGVHTFLVFDQEDETRLGQFSIIAGSAADADIRAEIELLRAELDMLKRAFRRHCVES